MIIFDPTISSLDNFYVLQTKRKNQNAYQGINNYSDKYANSTSSTSTTSTDNATSTSSTDSTNNVSDESSAVKMSANYSSEDIQNILTSLNLQDANNRFGLLLKLNTAQQNQLLPFLNKEQLSTGLKFFDKDTLRNMIYDLPKDKMLAMLFTQVPEKQNVVALFPQKALKQFLQSDKIKKDALMNVFEMSPKSNLEKIYEGATGVAAGKKSKSELLKSIGSLNKMYINEGLKTLPGKELTNTVSLLTKNDESLYTEFSKAAIFTPFENMTKPSMIDSSLALKPEDLVGMLEELPNNFVALTLTQMDPQVLSEQLQKNEKALLIELAQGA